MKKFHFRLDGFIEEDSRRWKKRTHPSSTAVNTVVWTVAIIAVIYAINHPRQIRITSPPSGTTTDNTVITVIGTVENPSIETIMLDVNGIPRTVSVKNSEFTSKVPLIRGKNTIQASMEGVVSNIIGSSNLINIMARIPHFDVWTELNWDGPGDVDLHLYLPNGEHCYYERKNTKSNAKLDIDNTERDGPEHIVMEKAISGARKYKITVLYFSAANDPPKPISWRVTVRLRAGLSQRMYSGVLHAVKEEQTVDTFTFP